MITIKPKTYEDWSQLVIQYGFGVHTIKYGNGGKRLEQCLDKRDYPQGLWNHTDNVGYIFAPEESVNE